MEIIPLVLILCLAVTFAWLASLPKRQDLRTISCLLVVCGVSVVVGAVAYPLGAYVLRVKAYQGEREIKEFLTNLHVDLSSNELEIAKEKIEFILSAWDDTEFIDQQDDWGYWIGDLVYEAKRLKYKTEPVDTDNPVNPPENSKNQLDD